MHKVFWCPELHNSKLGCVGRNMQQYQFIPWRIHCKMFVHRFLISSSISRKYPPNLQGWRTSRIWLAQASFSQDHCALQIPQMLSFVRTVCWRIKSLPHGSKWSAASALASPCLWCYRSGSSGDRAMAVPWRNTWSSSCFLSSSCKTLLLSFKGFPFFKDRLKVAVCLLWL